MTKSVKGHRAEAAQTHPPQKVEPMGSTGDSEAVEFLDEPPAEVVECLGSEAVQESQMDRDSKSDAHRDTKRHPLPKPAHGFLEPTTELAKRYFDDVQKRVLVSGARQPK